MVCLTPKIKKNVVVKNIKLNTILSEYLSKKLSSFFNSSIKFSLNPLILYKKNKI